MSITWPSGVLRISYESTALHDLCFLMRKYTSLMHGHRRRIWEKQTEHWQTEEKPTSIFLGLGKVSEMQQTHFVNHARKQIHTKSKLNIRPNFKWKPFLFSLADVKILRFAKRLLELSILLFMHLKGWARRTKCMMILNITSVWKNVNYLRY